MRTRRRQLQKLDPIGPQPRNAPVSCVHWSSDLSPNLFPILGLVTDPPAAIDRDQPCSTGFVAGNGSEEPIVRRPGDPTSHARGGVADGRRGLCQSALWGGWAHGGATNQLVSSAQEVGVSHSLVPPLLAR